MQHEYSKDMTNGIVQRYVEELQKKSVDTLFTEAGSPSKFGVNAVLRANNGSFADARALLPIRQAESRYVRENLLKYLAQFEYHMCDRFDADNNSIGTDADAVKTLVKVSNKSALFANCLFGHLSDADKAAKLASLQRFASVVGAGGQLTSDLARRVRAAGGLSADIIGGLQAIDNVDYHDERNWEIFQSVNDIFHNTANIDASRKNDVDNQIKGGGSDSRLAVDDSIGKIVVEVEKSNPHGAFSQNEKDELTRLIRGFSMSDVPTRIAQCLKTPTFKDGKLVINGQVVSNPQAQVDCIEQLMYKFTGGGGQGQSSIHDDCWCRLNAWLANRGIAAENIQSPGVNGMPRNFEAMLGDVTKGYFDGFCKVNQGLSMFLDPSEMENFSQTRDGKGWIIWKNNFDNEIRKFPTQPPAFQASHPLVNSLHQQQVTVENNKTKISEMRQSDEQEKSGGGPKNFVPYRAFKEIFIRMKKLLREVFSSFSMVGYMTKRLQLSAESVENCGPLAVAQRDDMLKQLNMEVLHAHAAASSLPANDPNRKDKIEAMRSYAEALSVMQPKLEQHKISMDEIEGITKRFDMEQKKVSHIADDMKPTQDRFETFMLHTAEMIKMNDDPNAKPTPKYTPLQAKVWLRTVGKAMSKNPEIKMQQADLALAAYNYATLRPDQKEKLKEELSPLMETMGTIYIEQINAQSVPPQTHTP